MDQRFTKEHNRAVLDRLLREASGFSSEALADFAWKNPKLSHEELAILSRRPVGEVKTIIRY